MGIEHAEQHLPFHFQGQSNLGSLSGSMTPLFSTSRVHPFRCYFGQRWFAVHHINDDAQIDHNQIVDEMKEPIEGGHREQGV
jgi:hypothetical protein